MTHLLFTNFLMLTSCLVFSVISMGQVKEKRRIEISNSKIEYNLLYDTSKTAIILFNRESKYPFDKFCKPATLTQDDIATIDSLLIACVNDYNRSFNGDYKQWGIDLQKRNYRKQLIVVTNQKGEKEVWVNCFCSTWNSNQWKTEIMLVFDGGNCYFNFKINLATKTFYDLIVNGVA